MRNLLKILYTYHFLLLFIALEVISVIMIVQNNNYHSAAYASKAKAISGSIYATINEFKEYLSLKDANKALARENALLRNYLKSSYGTFDTTRIILHDSIYKQLYRFQEAKVVNNTVNKQYNYITINKGSRHGIQPDMAVIGPNGVVGKINGVSENFSNILSVINVESKISAKLKKDNNLGSARWEGKDFEHCTLFEIPQHVNVQKGDTVVTTGFTSFPEGIIIGTVAGFTTKDGNFYEIDVKLSTDFNSLSYVSVVEYLMKDEVVKLENSTQK
ncbi:MAG: rod shape-determining protein MreC [Bacteroidales bacterium]|nr:rod shape-determining protein MreC [Bacteroidales bacterium]